MMAGDFVVGLALEIGLCLIIGYIISQPYENWILNGFFLLGAIWAVQIAIWLKKFIVRVATYYLYNKNRVADQAEIFLRKHQFPGHYSVWPDSIDYFNRVIQDEDATRDQVVYSAATLGQIELLKTVAPIASLQMQSALEKAIDRYLKAYELRMRRSYRSNED
jgi:hypothetical protein